MKTITKIAKEVQNQGGRLFFVGGLIRDAFIYADNIDNVDIDMAVQGLSFEQLVSIVEPFATSITKEAVGGSFAVVKAIVAGMDLDFALCRGEKKIGVLHTDFELDFTATIVDDLLRRDLTINAIAKDVLTGEIIDPFGGCADLHDGVAREVSSAFAEDALRVLRAARFIARFDLTPTQSLIDLCKTLDSSDIALPRFGQELFKTMKQAKTPSKFFEFLELVGWLEKVFPELHKLRSIEQSPVYHPEGNAFVHTMLCLDSAKEWFTRTVMVCHDLGKGVTTKLNSKGVWSHHNHDVASVELASNMLKRISFESFCGGQKVVDQIVTLASLHMLHTTPNIKDAKLLTRVRKLKSVGLEFSDLVRVMKADVMGTKSYDFCPIDRLSSRVSRFTLDGLFEPVVTGKMLVQAGVKPSPEFKTLLEKAQTLQDQGKLNKNNWKELLKL